MSPEEPGHSSTTMITTERLLLFPIDVSHATDLVTLHGDPNVTYWWAGSWSQDEAVAWAQAMAKRWRDDGVGKWIAYRQTDRALVGRGGLSITSLSGRRCLELGWTLRDEARGQGFATEIGRAGLRFARDQLGASEVYAFTEVINVASRAVMERLGMLHQGTIFRPGLIEGMEGMHDKAPFALYRTGLAETRPAARPSHS